MNRARLIRCFVGISVGCGAGAAVACLRLCTVIRRVSVSFDESLSPSFCCTLKKAIIEHPALQNLSIVSAQIKKDYSSIKAIVCFFSAPQQVHFVITAAQPLAQINDNLLITLDGTVVSKDCYEFAAYQNLPRIITCSSDQKQYDSLVHLYNFVIAACPELFNHFSVIWRDEFCIMLRANNSDTKNHTILIGSADTLSHMQVDDIYKKIDAIMSAIDNKNRPLVMDLRFTEQIIVYENCGEYGYGTGVG